jgi:hypothetical protein
VKINHCTVSILIAGILAFAGAGCHKQAASSEQPKTLAEGMTALQAALTTASPQAHSNYYALYLGTRYSDFAKATTALQQLASDPSLNDQQKKLVSDVSDLVKQAAAGQPAH